MSVVPIDQALLDAMPMPALPVESDKEARGRVLVVAGGAGVPGAALLTGLAALRVGAGKLKLAATPSLALGLGLAAPEAAIVAADADDEGEFAEGAAGLLAETAGGVDAVALGPGMLGQAAPILLRAIAGAGGGATLVIDAIALEGLMDDPSAVAAATGRLVLTPHAGEMASLLGWEKARVQAEPEDAARLVARTLGAVVALKGRATLVVSPDGRCWRHEGGVVGLGVSGSGDVLAGAIAGLAARGASPLAAAIRGVFVHGLAGRELSRAVAPLGFLAREIVDALPGAMHASRGFPGL